MSALLYGTVEVSQDLVDEARLGIRWMREVSRRSLAGQRCCVRLSKALSAIVVKLELEERGEITAREAQEVFAGPSDFLLRPTFFE